MSRRRRLFAEECSFSNPKRPPKFQGTVTLELLMQAVKKDDYLFLEDNLFDYIKKCRERVGRSESENILLDEALKSTSRNCVRILASPPYNIKLRCIGTLLHAFFMEDMWKMEATLPKLPEQYTTLRYNVDECSIPTMFLRPFDVAWGMKHCDVVHKLTRRRRRVFCGEPVAGLCNLFLELILSTPALSARIQEIEPVDYKAWSLTPPSKEDWLSHLNKCIGFPQCLLLHGKVGFFSYWCYTAHCLTSIIRLWTAHRFPPSVVTTDQPRIDPPSLLVCCRIRIRTCLLAPQEHHTEYPNYLTLVNRLPLPQNLRDFLLFKELWPKIPPNYCESDEDSILSEPTSDISDIDT